MSLHQNYKPKSIKRKIASIKSFTKYLLCEELIQENPFILLSTKIKDSSPLPKTIPFEIIEKIIINSYTQYNISKTPFEKKCSLRNIVILELLFSTGVRVSELVGIDIDSIDFNHQTIKILGKGSKERIIYISNSDVMDFLKKYNSFRPNTTNNAFFTNRINKRLSEQSVRGIINNSVKDCGLNSHITPHMFRHSFATLLLEEDVDIRYIQKLLGHSSITTTQIYTHVSSEKQKEILKLKHPRNKFKKLEVNKSLN